MIGIVLRNVVYSLVFAVVSVELKIHGRYTKSLHKYHLSIPHKLTSDGKFHSFHLPHFHPQKLEHHKGRRKRSSDDPEMIHYGISINGHLYHVELWPNRDFIHPNLIFEKRNLKIPIKDRFVRTMKDKKLCHYTGGVRGVPDSRAAISTCDGLAGYIIMGARKYFIEPVDDHSPNSEGHHLHVVFDKAPGDDKLSCGTMESWESAMKQRLREQALKGHDIFKVKRGLESVYRYMQVAVICDKKFLSYHSNRDVELYVMTIMNMVADYYHDASVGHQIDLVVVRVVYLEKEEEEIDLEINRDSGKTLASFCKWVVKINTPETSPNHYDMAVLLTRYDLCATAEEECDLSGLAYVAGACTKDKQCAINEDSGLLLSVVVTHEIGHLLGSEHDEEATSCPVQDTDGSYFVMSPIVGSFTLRWSSCSKSMITSLFENNLGECLNDIPQSTQYPFSNNLPGVVYDAKEQCKFMFPASLSVCGGLKEKICEQLVCKINAKQCVGKGEIPADGTKCAENKWCFKKECVSMGSRPQAINGGWGDWGPWSECSRSCGGGISSAQRECDNPVPANKGLYCLGDRRKVKICNTAPCPKDNMPFRQQQCAEHNTKPFNNEYYNWTMIFTETEPCVLYCLSEERIRAKLEPTVKDGTPCKHGTKNMCISGSCRKVGCDNELDSDAYEDRCGVCNGDGTQCKIVEDTFKDAGHGYTKVVVIPTGARKVVIEERGPSKNIIAIADSTEKQFYLNGDNVEEQDGEHIIGKMIGVYSHVEPKQDKFVMNGPLKEDLVLYISFYEKFNPGFTYKWVEQTVDPTYEPRYHWEIGEFSTCSMACEGGTQTSDINCMEEKAGKVSDNFCSGLDKPKEIIKNCNEWPCEKKWKVGEFGPCRACKAKGGVRTRAVECIKENPKVGGDNILLEDSDCEGPKPGAVELCKADYKCGRKRMVSYIPGKFQRDIWDQMSRRFERSKIDHKTTKSETEEHMEEEQEEKDNNETESGLSTTQNTFQRTVGRMVHDFRPLEEEILVRYTIQENPIEKNLSDQAEEEVGGEIGDLIDTNNTVQIKGKAAAQMKHILEHPTNETLMISCDGPKKAHHKKNKEKKHPGG